MGFRLASLSAVIGATGNSDALEAHVQELGLDLACSACALSTHSLRLVRGSKVKPKMKRKDKRAVAKQVLEDACVEDRFPRQLAIHGEHGEKQYADFMELQRQGGTLHNINMTPDNIKNVMKVCKTIFADESSRILDKIAKSKERLGGFNWERLLCVKTLKLCEKTVKHMSDEDEDEEEEAPSEDL